MSAQKAALRRAALDRRAAVVRREVSEGVAEALAGAVLAAAVLPAARGASRVAAYVSFGSEPPTTRLLPALAGAGVQVLVPVVLPGGDLDWAQWQPGHSAAGRGPVEPIGSLLGVEAVRTCSLVVVPALAVDARGNRLGRGGGSYDRALTRLPGDVLTAALLYDGELVERLPSEPHDVPVRSVVTPSGGLARLSSPQAGVVRWLP